MSAYTITLVTGKSGSGKSSFLVKHILQHLHDANCPAVYCNMSLERDHPDFAEAIAENRLRFFANPVAERPGDTESWLEPDDDGVYRADGLLMLYDGAAKVQHGGDATLPSGSLIVLDEATDWFAEGAIKNKAVINFLRKHRHLSINLLFAGPGHNVTIFATHLRKSFHVHHHFIDLKQIRFCGGLLPGLPVRRHEVRYRLNKTADACSVWDPKPFWNHYNSQGGILGAEIEQKDDHDTKANAAASRASRLVWAGVFGIGCLIGLWCLNTLQGLPTRFSHLGEPPASSAKTEAAWEPIALTPQQVAKVFGSRPEKPPEPTPAPPPVPFGWTDREIFLDGELSGCKVGEARGEWWLAGIDMEKGPFWEPLPK